MNLFFDTETTGLPYGNALDDPAYPWPVEVAGVLASGSGDTVGSFRLVVRPGRWSIPEEVVKIHDIDVEYARMYGVDLEQVLTVTAVFARQAKTVLGWNVNFDCRIIESAALRLKLSNPLKDLPLKDVMQETSAFLGLGRMSMQKAYDWLFKQPLPGAHTAMGDVRACQAIWKKIQKHDRPG